MLCVYVYNIYIYMYIERDIMCMCIHISYIYIYIYTHMYVYTYACIMVGAAGCVARVGDGWVCESAVWRPLASDLVTCHWLWVLW